MDYHFNSHTIVQLVHLLRNQTYNALTSDFISGSYKFKVLRKDSPNEGEYWIKINNIVEIKNLPTAGISNDTIQSIEYDNLSKTLSIIGKLFRIIFKVDLLNVSAVGIEN